MALVNTETGETFDAEFAASLERWLEQNIEVGIATVEAFEASESLKDVQDQIKQLMIVIALNKTMTKKANRNGSEYQEWNQQKAALVLGITHSQLQAGIKKFGIEQPSTDDSQGDFFGAETLRVVK
jgi:transcriptional regulator with GAF, ATPase, and Fis domain